MWRNIPKTQKKLKERCLKELSIIVSKKVFMSAQVRLNIHYNVDKLPNPHTIYTVWRRDKTPWWFADGEFVPIIGKAPDKERKKIAKWIKFFKEEKKPRSFVVIVYRNGSKSFILDGNHRLLAIYQSSIQNYPLRIINIECDADIADRLSPDTYVANRFTKGV